MITRIFLKVSKKVFFKPLSSGLSEEFAKDTFFFKMPSYTFQSESEDGMNNFYNLVIKSDIVRSL